MMMTNETIKRNKICLNNIDTDGSTEKYGKIKNEKDKDKHKEHIEDDWDIETFGNDKILSMVRDDSMDSEKLYDEISSTVAEENDIDIITPAGTNDQDTIC